LLNSRAARSLRPCYCDAMSFSVIKNAKVKSAISSLGEKIKKGVHLVDALDKGYRVDVVIVDSIIPQSEIHEHGRDVWYVLSGSGYFVLGGSLTNQTEKKPGELVGDGIEGGERYEAEPGDIIDINPGTAHQICSDSRLELLLVKLEPAK
jgi:mannose-6-phosphate isomerase-like protein (cupin superfamily)